MKVALGDLSPRPPGIYRFGLLQQKGGGRTTCFKGRPALLLCAGSRSALGSHPCVALSSAGAKGAFPVSVSFRVYRGGNGQRQFKLVTPGITNDLALGGEFG